MQANMFCAATMLEVETGPRHLALRLSVLGGPACLCLLPGFSVCVLASCPAMAVLPIFPLLSMCLPFRGLRRPQQTVHRLSRQRFSSAAQQSCRSCQNQPARRQQHCRSCHQPCGSRWEVWCVQQRRRQFESMFGTSSACQMSFWHLIS